MRVIVVINPGNPTGASLSYANIAAVIKFAVDNGLISLADEVYQTNIFTGEFISVKKVLSEHQHDHPHGLYTNMELVLFHSVSKGMIAECGYCGGYMELVGLEKSVKDQINKFILIILCLLVIV